MSIDINYLMLYNKIIESNVPAPPYYLNLSTILNDPLVRELPPGLFYLGVFPPCGKGFS